ncbi:MAG TPA: hypothetical protein VJT82_04005, partial [Pyrinomonadaceae bacterium]|nr:hypothetical protein [Pyrinomonadaceae bacterium]
RHALVVITDGGDRARQVKLDELIKYLREHDVQVFVFALTDAVRADSFGGSGNSRGKARSLLNTLAEQTGGVALFPKKPAEFNAAVATLNGLLRSPRYVIGYAAKENLKDKPRKVEVKLADSATGGKRSLVVRPFVK